MRFTFATLAGLTIGAMTLPSAAAELSPVRWRADYERYLSEQAVTRTEAGHASGTNGAVTVAYNGLAARAGLEALKQGGNAIDAALTAANMQVALTAGAPISYFGILSLVYYDAKSGKVYTMNAEWNTVRGETEPMTIPGALTMSGSLDALRGGQPSGRTALVGGFTKGVEAAHKRFGRLPFAQFGMSVREAIDAPDFFLPRTDPKSMQLTVVVPKGRFEHSVLDAMGYDYDEADSEQSRFAGEGIWVGISRDPSTGRLEAASHNRNNSAAVAF